MFEEIGRLQWQEGKDLTTLLAAYQLGARVAWRHVSPTALDLEVAPAVLAALAEAVFVFIDQLSSASARGYVLEQSEVGRPRGTPPRRTRRPAAVRSLGLDRGPGGRRRGPGGRCHDRAR